MDCIKKKVNEELDRGWIGSNLTCDYHPCHFRGQDCTFCYCPFFPCNDEELGEMIHGSFGEVWSCSDCLFIHNKEVCRFVISECERLGIKEAKDPRFIDLFKEAKSRFYHHGRALMVVGATSDAGKSTMVAALCRILHRNGNLVAPFKSQNMSLNSRATLFGTEVAVAQVLQAQAAGLTNPDTHMNPILLKPKGDTVSQVIVNGKPFKDYDVGSYYGEFIPEHGRRIVRDNVEFLKRRYDYVIMEGAGSPAEINIYDVDIANMGAAVEADADVVLVVNVEWGGAFAYALGTIELIPKNDRSRIKGVIFNNIRGDMDRFKTGADEFSRISGVPVLGCIPRMDIYLPSEDSEALRGVRRKGTGQIRIGVIRYPHIANFTDIDPLFLEDVSVIFVDQPSDLEDIDAIILPGTKNSVDDLQWMRSNCLADRISSYKGKVPIVGICGGFQMMGSMIEDPQGIDGNVPGTHEGLGFFDMVTKFEGYTKRVVKDDGRLLAGDGGAISGYEIHMGTSDINEDPLFEITNLQDRGPQNEGAIKEDEMLYGTYLHGVFDKRPFRSFILSKVDPKGRTFAKVDPVDYDELVDHNLDVLADIVENNLDMDAIMDLLGD